MGLNYDYAVKVPITINGKKYYYMVTLIRDAIEYIGKNGFYTKITIPLKVRIFIVDEKGRGITMPHPSINLMVKDEQGKIKYADNNDVNKFFVGLRKYTKELIDRYESSYPMFDVRTKLNNFDNMIESMSVFYKVKALEEYINNPTLLVPEISLSTMRMLLGRSEVQDYFIKKMQDFYSSLLLLTPEEVNSLENFTLSYTALSRKVWKKSYNSQLIDKVIRSYEKITGNYFIPRVLMNGSDDIDKKALKYITLLAHVSSKSTLISKIKNYYDNRKGLSYHHAIIKQWEKQVDKIKQGKGNIVGYKVKDVAGNVVIRLFNKKDADTSHFPSVMVKDASLSGKSIREFYSPTVKRIDDYNLVKYKNIIHLSHQEEEKLVNFSMTDVEIKNHIENNQWDNNYKNELVKKMLEAYYKATGNYFVPVGMFRSVKYGKMEKKLFLFIAYITNSTYVGDIHFFTMKIYRDYMGVDENKIIEEFNKKQKQEILNAKGKLVGVIMRYVLNQPSFVDNLIRVVPIGQCIDKNSVECTVKVYGAWTHVDVPRLQTHTVNKGGIITYDKLLQNIGANNIDL